MVHFLSLVKKKTLRDETHIVAQSYFARRNSKLRCATKNISSLTPNLDSSKYRGCIIIFNFKWFIFPFKFMISLTLSLCLITSSWKVEGCSMPSYLKPLLMYGNTIIQKLRITFKLGLVKSIFLPIRKLLSLWWIP